MAHDVKPISVQLASLKDVGAIPDWAVFDILVEKSCFDMFPFLNSDFFKPKKTGIISFFLSEQQRFCKKKRSHMDILSLTGGADLDSSRLVGCRTFFTCE